MEEKLITQQIIFRLNVLIKDVIGSRIDTLYNQHKLKSKICKLTTFEHFKPNLLHSNIKKDNFSEKKKGRRWQFSLFWLKLPV